MRVGGILSYNLSYNISYRKKHPLYSLVAERFTKTLCSLLWAFCSLLCAYCEGFVGVLCGVLCRHFGRGYSGKRSPGSVIIILVGLPLML